MEHPKLRKGMLLGIGNPLLDVSANVEKDVLDKYDMTPNNAILAAEIHKPLCGELIQKYSAQFIAGGSTQNSLRVAQWILEEPNVTTFFGCVGDDEYAKILEKYARSNGVNVKYQYNENEPTGTCAVLITDKHRSLCADLGAANTFTIDHIRKPENWSCIENADMYYISGFFLTVSPSTALEVANYAFSKNRPFIMNLSAPFISEFFSERLMELLPFIDILLGNESEAEMFANVQNFGTKDLRKIALKVCELPKKNPHRSRVCIITQGPDAVILAQNGTITEFPVKHVPEDKVVDTNGAGDAFVGGFLGQLVMGKPLDVCIKCGIWTAREIIQKSGCTFEGKACFNV